MTKKHPTYLKKAERFTEQIVCNAVALLSPFKDVHGFADLKRYLALALKASSNSSHDLILPLRIVKEERDVGSHLSFLSFDVTTRKLRESAFIRNDRLRNRFTLVLNKKISKTLYCSLRIVVTPKENRKSENQLVFCNHFTKTKGDHS